MKLQALPRPALWLAPTLAAAYAWLYYLHSHTPLLADDYCMLFPSLSAALSHVAGLYTTWSGRSVGFFLTDAFLLAPKTLFNLLTPLLTLGLTALLIFTTHGKAALTRPALWLIAFAVPWLYTPSLGDTMFWVSGAANYYYTAALQLLWLLPLYRLAWGKPLTGPWLYAWPLLGIFAGWTNENSAPAILILGSICATIAYRQHRRLPLWAWLSLAAMLVGILLMLLAPGNMMRASAPMFQQLNAIDWLTRIIVFAIAVPGLYLPLFTAPLLIIAAQLGIIAAKSPSIAAAFSKPAAISAILTTATALLALGALVLAPYVENRALITLPLLFTLAILQLWPTLSANTPWLARGLLAWLSVCLLGSILVTTYNKSLVWSITQQQLASFQACYGSQSPQCSTVPYPTVPSRTIPETTRGLITPAKDDWINQCRINAFQQGIPH